MLEGESIRSITADPKIPAISTLMRWYVDEKPEHKEFREQFEKALKGHAIIKGLEAVDCVDETPKKRLVTKGGNGEEKFIEVEEIDSAGVTRNGRRAMVRQWVAGKLMRKLFGEKTEEDPNATIDIADRMRRGIERVRKNAAK